MFAGAGGERAEELEISEALEAARERPGVELLLLVLSAGGGTESMIVAASEKMSLRKEERSSVGIDVKSAGERDFNAS